MDRTTSNKFINNEPVILLATFLLAFALRYHFLNKYCHMMLTHEQDAVGYMAAAKTFLHLQFPGVTGRPPGYSLVIALFALLPVSLEYAARLASIFMDSSIIVPLYYIARVHLSRMAAFSVSLLWAFFSFGLFYTTSPLSQSSYLCYLIFGVAAFHIAWQKSQPKWFLCSGLLMSLSYLTRPEGIAGILYGFLLCTILLIERRSTFRIRILNISFYVLGFLLLGGSYIVAMRVALGEWTLSALASSQISGPDFILNLRGNGQILHKSWTSVWQNYYENLPHLIDIIRNNVYEFAEAYFRHLPFLFHIFTILGLIALIFRSSWRYILLIMTFFAVITPVFVINLPRTLSYIYPIFIVTFLCVGFFRLFVVSSG